MIGIEKIDDMFENDSLKIKVVYPTFAKIFFLLLNYHPFKFLGILFIPFYAALVTICLYHSTLISLSLIGSNSNSADLAPIIFISGLLFVLFVLCFWLVMKVFQPVTQYFNIQSLFLLNEKSLFYVYKNVNNNEKEVLRIIIEEMVKIQNGVYSYQLMNIYFILNFIILSRVLKKTATSIKEFYFLSLSVIKNIIAKLKNKQKPVLVNENNCSSLFTNFEKQLLKDTNQNVKHNTTKIL